MLYYGLLLFFVLDYVRPGSYVPALDALHLNSLVPLGVVLGTLFSRGRVSAGDVLREGNTKIILVLLGMIVVSILTADVTTYAFDRFTAVLGYAMAYWAITQLATDVDRLKGIFKALVFVHLLVAVLNPLMITEPEVRHYVTSGAFLGDGNDYALSVNIVIPLCLFLIFDSPKIRHKIVYGAVLLFLVLMVVATQSRGGSVALGCVALYYWSKSDRKLAMMAVTAVALVAVLLFAPPAYFERMNTVSAEEGSAQGRILAWRGAVKMAMDHPLLGVGAGHFAVKYGAEYRASLDVPWQTAHSVYFLALGELGFPGLTLVLVLIVSNLVANRRAGLHRGGRGDPLASSDHNLLACLSASLLAFATGAAFLSALYYPHMYVLAGLFVAARRVVREHADAPARRSDEATQTRTSPAAVRGPAGVSPDWRPRRVVPPGASARNPA